MMDRSADRWARAVGYAVNPLVLPPLLFALVLGLFGAPAAEIGRVSLVSALFLTGAPLGSICWMVWSGRARSFDVREAATRRIPFLVGLTAAFGSLGSLSMLTETARPFVLALAALLAVDVALLGLITLRWKISVHAAAAAGFVSVLVFASYFVASRWTLALFIATSMLIPVVMWARVRAHVHSPSEVLAGALFGLVVPLAQLVLLAEMGLLDAPAGTLP